MPAKKNAPKLTKAKKAKVLAEKQLGISTVKNIAKSNKIVENTVYRIARTKDPEVIALAEIEKELLTARINSARDDALRELNVKINAGEMPGNHLATAFGILYDKSRLEENKATEIKGTVAPVNAALEFIAQARSRGYTNAQIVEGLDAIADIDKETRDRMRPLLME